MKLNQALKTRLPLYPYMIESWDNWIEIRDSGKWNPNMVDCDVNFSDHFLTSLKGAPEYIGGHFFCSNTGLETLEGAPKEIKNIFYCNNNELMTLKNVHKQINSIGDTFGLAANPIVSNILGLLLIKNLKMVKHKHPAFQFIVRHLNKDRDVLECQEELISAGYKEFAKL